MNQYFVPRWLFVFLACFPNLLFAAERFKVEIKSSADGTMQPSYVILPDGFRPGGPPVPLVVSLHSWSGDLEQRNKDFETEANRRGWIYLFPNFRGANQHPDACGSVKAQRDILDAVAWAKASFPIDSRRVYLTGTSGGGHMTMLMVARHPRAFTAASAWVGISDLAAWHRKHQKSRYGEMMRKSCGGAPGSSSAVDQQFRARSPLTYLKQAVDVPLDIAAGVHDGHKGSVPIRHSLEAFNEIARAAKQTGVTEEEIQQLSQPNGRLRQPQASDKTEDASLGRKVHLRRHAAKSRVTIFEGGHEGIATAAFAWLEKHSTR